MKNPYKDRLIILFERIIELKHSSNRINSVLNKDVQKYTTENARFFSGSKLIISDWTGPTDNGWELNFNTGIRKEIWKDDYAKEVENIISRECCLAFAQAFESLESFFKDCIFIKSQRTDIFDFQTRDEIPGGNKLFRLIKKASSPDYTDYSLTNNKNIRFKQFWTVISESRHSVVHSSCRLEKRKINLSVDHFATFEYLFNYEEINDNILFLKLSFRDLDKILKHIAEFAYQFNKLWSIKEELEFRFN